MKTRCACLNHFRHAVVTVAASLAFLSLDAAAQISPPLDVTASQPVYNSDGATLLPGSNPFAGNSGYTVVPGCVVQIINAGANGVADPPDHNGNPNGDDTVVATTTIGTGIAPDVTLSGRFSVSVYPPPASGSQLYVRVFNTTTASAATYYGQSSLFTVSGVNVLDVSSLGLSATTQPLDHTAPTLLAAVSRKTHGAAGTFDLNLSLDPASPTVEPRIGGPTTIVFTFSEPVTTVGGSLTASNFTLTNATYVSAAVVSTNLTLNLTAVTDQSVVTIVLNGITDLSGNALSGTNAVLVRALYGDVNQNGSVNVVDMQRVKNNLLQGLTTANFLCDVNCNGGINVVDLQNIKNNLLHAVSLAAPSGTGLTGTASLLVTGADSGSTTNAVSASATLGDALGSAGLVWSTGGDAGWTATVAEDGSSASWSGKIGDLNVSWMEATVTGPGTLSFDWMVSSEQGGDCLTFSIDGVAQPGAISGEVNWQTLTFSIPAGTHRLTWTYSKNGSGSSGLDAGWVRSVVFE